MVFYPDRYSVQTAHRDTNSYSLITELCKIHPTDTLGCSSSDGTSGLTALNNNIDQSSFHKNNILLWGLLVFTGVMALPIAASSEGLPQQGGQEGDSIYPQVHGLSRASYTTWTIRPCPHFLFLNSCSNPPWIRWYLLLPWALLT